MRAEGDEADDGAQVQGEQAVTGVLGEHAVEGGGHAEAALMNIQRCTKMWVIGCVNLSKSTQPSALI